MERQPCVRRLVQREVHALVRTEYDPHAGREAQVYSCDSARCLYLQRLIPPSTHILTRLKIKGVWRTTFATDNMVVTNTSDGPRHYHIACWRAFRGR